jgi:hypothetical protein
MKLVRWTLAGASFYVIYKYAIGKKAKGEEVFAAPEQEVSPPPPAEPKPKPKPKAKPKAPAKPRAKKPAAPK